MNVTTGTTSTTVNSGGFSVVGTNANDGNSMVFNAATGMATFKSDTTGVAGTTTIQGNTVTTGVLKTNTLQLGNADNPNITISSDGSASFANGKFEVAVDGSLTTKNNLSQASFTVNAVTGALTANSGTFGQDSANQTIIDKGTYKSSATAGTKKNVTSSTAEGEELTVTDTSGNLSYNDKVTASGSTTTVSNGNQTVTDAVNATSVKTSMKNGDAVDSKIVTEEMTIDGTITTVKGQTTTAAVTTTATGLNIAGAAANFDFNTDTGVSTFKGTDATATTVSGSVVTSTNGAGVGVLDGSSMTLTSGAAVTALTAGGATFNGTAGASTAAGTSTTIDGGTITTDTLKVERIELGETMVDANGQPVGGSNLTISADGSLKAAAGNFTVSKDGEVQNTVGQTSFTTSAAGVTSTVGTAGGNQGSSIVTGSSVTSSVTGANGTSSSTVTDNGISNTTNGASSVITGGTGANITDTVGTSSSKLDGTSITDTVGTSSVTTTTDGTVFENSAQNTPFTEGGATNTTINGNTITTGHLTTDKLTITSNNGEAGGTNSGSLTLAGNGSISGNIIDTAKPGASVDYATTIDGSKLEVNDGLGNITNTETTAAGTAIKVTDGNNTADSKVSADEILNKVNDNSVTIGTDAITSAVGTDVKTEMTAGGITSTVGTTSQTIAADSVTTAADGYTTTLNKDGLGVTNGTGGTQITSGDVSIKTDAYDIKLSEMGQVKDIDSELQGRGEYDGTVVGGLNAEAGIRREEVARLDSRIDRTEERLDRVGAMAAAAASLKSMGYDPAAPTEFAMGVGTYKGSQALAVGLFHYPNRDFMLNINYTQSGSERMGGVGATWKFGRKNPDKVLDDQLKERQKKVKIAQEKAEAAQVLAKEANERAAYAAKQAQLAKTEAATATRDAEKAYADKEVYDEYRAKRAQ